MAEHPEAERRKADREGYAWTVGIWLASCVFAAVIGMLFKHHP